MATDSLRNVKDRFSEFVGRVDREHERIVVTRNGRPAAVLISPAAAVNVERAATGDACATHLLGLTHSRA